MTPESQLIALLEFLGWTHEVVSPALAPYLGVKEGSRWWVDPNRNTENDSVEGPKLTLDLMHEAEEKICAQAMTGYTYDMALCDVTKCMEDNHPNFMRLWHATKEQRLEALLRTLNKWVESEVVVTTPEGGDYVCTANRIAPKCPGCVHCS